MKIRPKKRTAEKPTKKEEQSWLSKLEVIAKFLAAIDKIIPTMEKLLKGIFELL